MKKKKIEIFSIKRGKIIFIIIFRKKTSSIISKFTEIFSEDFFEVMHIFVGQKMMILKNHPDFLTFLDNKQKSSEYKHQPSC